MFLRDRMLGGVSHSALFAAAGEGGGGVPDDQGQPDGIVIDNGPDDGFTPEERAQFSEMQQPEPPADAPVDGEKTAAEQTGGDQGEKPAGEGGEGGDEDDGDDDVGDKPAAGQEGKLPSRRVNRKTHERELAARDARIKQLEEETNASKEMQARLDERMKIINEALTPKQQQQMEEDDPEPDREENIFEHNGWLSRQLQKTQKMVEQLSGGLQQRDTQTDVERTYVSDVQRFAAQEPAFMQAYNFLMASRVAELAIYRFGVDDPKALTPQQLQAIGGIVENEENQLVAAALRSGRSPAQQMFALAKTRGYQPPKADEAGGAKPNGHAADAKPNGNGAAAKQDAKPSVVEEIRRVKAGVEASTSLSNAGGAPAMTLTPEKLANMPQEEFNALMDSLDENEQRRVMGGR